MKNFMDENFLLQTETAQKLYHEHAAKMPIIGVSGFSWLVSFLLSV